MNDNRRLAIELVLSTSGFIVTLEGNERSDLAGFAHVLKAYVRKMLADARFNGMDAKHRENVWNPTILAQSRSSLRFEAQPNPGWPIAAMLLHLMSAPVTSKESA